MTTWTDNFIAYGEKYYAGVNRDFIKTTAYWIYATALGKRAYAPLGQLRLYPNMYLVLMANRKRGKTLLTTTAEQIVHSILPAQAKLPTDFSDEGFDDRLADSQGHGYLHYRELIELLAHLDKAKKAVAKFNTFFDWSPIDTISHTRMGGTKIIPAGTVMSFISGITPSAFATGLRQTVLTSGGLSRFIIMRDENRTPLPPPPDTPDDYVPLLTAALRESLSNEYLQIKLNNDAREYWRYLNEEYMPKETAKAADPQMFEEITARVDHHLIKCALVRAYQHHSITITEEHMHTAFNDVIEPYIRAAKLVAADGIIENDYQRNRARIVERIREQKTMFLRDLMMAVRMKRASVIEILDELEAEGLIETVDSGRSTKWIYWNDLREAHRPPPPARDANKTKHTVATNGNRNGHIADPTNNGHIHPRSGQQSEIR